MEKPIRQVRASTQEEVNRRENLRALARHHGQKQLAQRLGVTQSTLSQIVGPKYSRNLRAYLAREYEAKLGIPAGSLDRPHEVSETDAPVVALPTALSPAAAPSRRASDLNTGHTADVGQQFPDVLASVGFVRAVDNIAAQEGINLPDAKAADIISVVITAANKTGSAPDLELARSIVKLLK